MKSPFFNQDVAFCWAGPAADAGRLLGDEALLVINAVDIRKREFSLGRSCARCALGKLGVNEQAIHQGSHGEPLWPADVAGSISHTQGHAISAAAFKDSNCISVGVDLEAYVPLNDGVLPMVLTGPELRRLGSNLDNKTNEGLLLFSAKEAIYKAWFPLVPVRVGFHACELEWDFERMTFIGRVTAAGADLPFVGQWSFPSEFDGLVLTTAEASP